MVTIYHGHTTFQYVAEIHKNNQPGYIIEHDHYLMQSTCKVGNNDGNTTF